MATSLALAGPPQVRAGHDAAPSRSASCRPPQYHHRLAPPVSAWRLGGALDLQRAGGSQRAKDAAARRLCPTPGTARHYHRLRQLRGAPALAPGRVGLGGDLSTPPWHRALPTPGQAQTTAPEPRKKN